VTDDVIHTDTLARRYRRLLLAYPGWYRRLHGCDQLTMMLDAAAAGRAARPFTLVLDGIRCRLRVPGALAAMLAMVMSLAGAGVLAGAMSWAGWHATSGPLTIKQAAELAAPALLAEQPGSVESWGGALGGIEFSYKLPATAQGRAAETAAMRDRLAAAGWRAQASADGAALGARRGAIDVLVLHHGCAVPASCDHMTILVRPILSGPVQPLGYVGAVLGALVGWLVTAAAFGRARRQPWSRRATAVALAVLGVLFAAPTCAVNLLVLSRADLGGTPPWIGFETPGLRLAMALGAVTLAAAGLLPTATRVRRHGAVPAPHGLR
jgi:hypothetical protein